MHTLGNWEARSFGDESKEVCCITPDVSVYTDADVIGSAKCDALLISAAPEMLKLLQQLQVEGGLGMGKHKRIEAVINKATGNKNEHQQ